MNKETENSKVANAARVKIVYSIFAILLLAGYIFIYQRTPFSGSLNDLALTLITTLASLFVAVTAAFIYFHYYPEDHPRKMWLYLMAGSSFWFLSELIWVVLTLKFDEVPVPSLADAGWVSGFICFTFAFYYQYTLVFPQKKQAIRNIALAAWAVVLFIPFISLLAAGTLTIESYINYFYPLADFAVGIAGLMLVFVFQGGALMRPWLGLVVFGVSDLLYAWAEQAGLYTWSATNNSLLTLTIDTSYLAAYLILGSGFLDHWILINYGLRAKKN